MSETKKSGEKMKSREKTAGKASEKAKEALEKSQKIAKTGAEKGGKVGKEFAEFINRGSVVDLAVGVAVGGAFTTIVNSLVNDIVMPIVSLIGGGFDFTNLAIEIPNFFNGGPGAVIRYGNFIQTIVNFLIIALVIFNVVKLTNKFHKKKEEKAAKKTDEEILSTLKEISAKLGEKHER